MTTRRFFFENKIIQKNLKKQPADSHNQRCSFAKNLNFLFRDAPQLTNGGCESGQIWPALFGGESFKVEEEAFVPSGRWPVFELKSSPN